MSKTTPRYLLISNGAGTDPFSPELDNSAGVEFFADKASAREAMHKHFFDALTEEAKECWGGWEYSAKLDSLGNETISEGDNNFWFTVSANSATFTTDEDGVSTAEGWTIVPIPESV